MPIDTNQSITGLKKNVSSLPIIDKIINNPFSTAIAISIILIIILIFVFADVEVNEDTSLFKLAFRASIYTFIISAGLIFLNNYYLKEEFNTMNKSEQLENIFGGVDTVGQGIPIAGNDLINIKPNITLPEYNFDNIKL